MLWLVRIDYMDRFIIDYFCIFDISLELVEVNVEGGGEGELRGVFKCKWS